jgi:hypothetical protein
LAAAATAEFAACVAGLPIADVGCVAVTGPPEDVLTARLVGGELDGLLAEIDGGEETLRFGPPLAVWGALDSVAAEEIERWQQATFEYRFVGIEDVEAPEETHEAARRAVFELVEDASSGDSAANQHQVRTDLDATDPDRARRERLGTREER